MDTTKHQTKITIHKWIILTLLLTLVLLVVSANPAQIQADDGTDESTTEQTATGSQPPPATLGAILLDRSGSMNNTTATGNTRCKDSITLAIAGAQDFFNEANGNGEMSIWTFTKEGIDPQIENITNGFVNEQDALAALNSLDPTGCDGLTPLANGLCAVYDQFLSMNAPNDVKRFDIYSDGGENASEGECSGPYSKTPPPNYSQGSWQNVVSALYQLNGFVNAFVYDTVTRSQTSLADDGSTVNRSTETEDTFAFLKDLATATGGVYINLNTNAPITITIDPDLSSVEVGALTTVDITASSLTGFNGVDVTLSFDPTLLEVTDLEDGDCLDLILSPDDSYDNAYGKIFYAGLKLGSSCNDAVIATVTFKGLTPGSSALTFDQVLASNNGAPLIPQITHGQIDVVEPTGVVEGVATLQGRSQHDGTTIALYDSAGQVVATTITDAQGAYQLAAVGGTYTVRASMDRYLDVEQASINVVVGQTLQLTDVMLPGGDVNRDGKISIHDLAGMAGDYNFDVPPANPDHDITNNGRVDIFDLTVAASNYNATAPIAWP